MAGVFVILHVILSWLDVFCAWSAVKLSPMCDKLIAEPINLDLRQIVVPEHNGPFPEPVPGGIARDALHGCKLHPQHSLLSKRQTKFKLKCHLKSGRFDNNLNRCRRLINPQASKVRKKDRTI